MDEIYQKYKEYQIYEKSTFRKYILEEIFIQSYIISNYDIDEFIYFCNRYLEWRELHTKGINMPQPIQNNEQYIELYNHILHHTKSLSIKPVPRVYDNFLR